MVEVKVKVLGKNLTREQAIELHKALGKELGLVDPMKDLFPTRTIPHHEPYTTKPFITDPFKYPTTTTYGSDTQIRNITPYFGPGEPLRPTSSLP